MGEAKENGKRERKICESLRVGEERDVRGRGGLSYVWKKVLFAGSFRPVRETY